MLGKAWPGLDVRALGYAVRTHLPLVQVPSETRWGWPGAASFAVAESWLGRTMGKGGGASALVLRYLGAFGPASVRDAQTWSGMRSLAEAFEALRPKLAVFPDEHGRELFDLPDAPRPPADTPGAGPLPARVRQPRARARRPDAGRPRSASPAPGDEEPAGPGDLPGRRVRRGKLEDRTGAVRPGRARPHRLRAVVEEGESRAGRRGKGAPGLRGKRRRFRRGAVLVTGRAIYSAGRYRPFASVSAMAASSTSRARTCAPGTRAASLPAIPRSRRQDLVTGPASPRRWTSAGGASPPAATGVSVPAKAPIGRAVRAPRRGASGTHRPPPAGRPAPPPSASTRLTAWRRS